jgi:hypothetical protein
MIEMATATVARTAIDQQLPNSSGLPAGRPLLSFQASD